MGAWPDVKESGSGVTSSIRKYIYTHVDYTTCCLICYKTKCNTSSRTRFTRLPMYWLYKLRMYPLQHVTHVRDISLWLYTYDWVTCRFPTYLHTIAWFYFHFGVPCIYSCLWLCILKRINQDVMDHPNHRICFSLCMIFQLLVRGSNYTID